MTSGQAGKGMGSGSNRGSQSVGQDIDDNPTLGPSDVQGRNKLQGDDQKRVHNQRHTMAEETSEPDHSAVESFVKMDPKARADQGDN